MIAMTLADSLQICGSMIEKVRQVDGLESFDDDDYFIYAGMVSMALSPQLRVMLLVFPQTLINVFIKESFFTDQYTPHLEQITQISFL
jgi:DNA-binding transcriptional MocR family regulator